MRTVIAILVLVASSCALAHSSSSSSTGSSGSGQHHHGSSSSGSSQASGTCGDSDVATDPLRTTLYQNCSMITDCRRLLCQCMDNTTASSAGSSTSTSSSWGSSGSGSTEWRYPRCLLATTGNCSATTSCFANYLQCLSAISSQRSNASNENCSGYANNVYAAQQNATGVVAFNSTTLYRSCVFELCRLEGIAGTTHCRNATTTVCSAQYLIPSESNSPAPTMAPGSGSGSGIGGNSTALGATGVSAMVTVAAIASLFA